MGFIKNAKFEKFISRQRISEESVYGSNFSICANEREIVEKGFSRILVRLLNEQRAERKGGMVYFDPYYDQYSVNLFDRLRRKLLSLVRKDNFRALIEQSELVKKETDNKEGTDNKEQYFYRIEQIAIKNYKCLPIFAELLNKEHASMDEDNNVLLRLDYLEKLETSKQVQLDLSHFRTLLGECDNLQNFLRLVEACDFKDGKIVIEMREVKEKGLKTELFSLCDLGVATINDSDKREFIIDPEFASWLLECVESTSDRISFVNMYSE